MVKYCKRKELFFATIFIVEMTMECKKRKHEEIDETKVRMRKETMNEILQKGLYKFLSS